MPTTDRFTVVAARPVKVAFSVLLTLARLTKPVAPVRPNVTAPLNVDEIVSMLVIEAGVTDVRISTLRMSSPSPPSRLSSAFSVLVVPAEPPSEESKLSSPVSPVHVFVLVVSDLEHGFLSH